MATQTNYLIKVLSSVVLSLLCLFFATGTASAQVSRDFVGTAGQNDFVLEPAKHEVIAVPGETQNKKISITNRTEQTLEFNIQIEDFVGSTDKEQQVKLLGDQEGPYSLKNFVKPEVSTFILDSGERINIPITVSLPDNAEPRGYYGAVIISAENPDENQSLEDSTSTEIVTRLGSLFLVRVDGDLVEESNLELFKALGEDKKLYSQHPGGFELAVKNTGNVHLVHYGQIVIKNLFGKEIERFPINGYFSLPDSVRYQQVIWPNSFTLGKYTAVLDIHKGYGDENLNTHQQQISFWVIPWNVILPLFLVIIVLVFMFSKLSKRFAIVKKK
jgi:hypothetical protein